MSKTELKKSEESEEIRVSDTELIDRIRAKLGGKELSSKLTKSIIDTNDLFLKTKERSVLTYGIALNEGFSKEEAKTIVSEIYGISVRSVARYIPDEMKDPKYISDRNRSKQLEDRTQEPTTGIVNEDGKYEYADGENETIEQTPEQQIKDLKETIKKLSKPWDDTHEITVQGRTFNVKTHSDPVKRVTELNYREMEIVRALKSK